jgi:hypothetical protein
MVSSRNTSLRWLMESLCVATRAGTSIMKMVPQPCGSSKLKALRISLRFRNVRTTTARYRDCDRRSETTSITVEILLNEALFSSPCESPCERRQLQQKAALCKYRYSFILKCRSMFITYFISNMAKNHALPVFAVLQTVSSIPCCTGTELRNLLMHVAGTDICILPCLVKIFRPCRWPGCAPQAIG